MKRTRIYPDTSVFGAVFDPEFSPYTLKLFSEVLEGRHILVISEVTAKELEGAPARVRDWLGGLPKTALEEIPFTNEMAELRDAYLARGVISLKWKDDAAHVAAAAVTRVDILVSWNFRHLVNWQRSRGFNAVNLELGYPMVTIMTPREVVTDEEDI